MTSKIFTSIGILFFVALSSFGQDSGDRMYDNSILHEIRFEFSQPNYWNNLISNYEENADPFDTKPYLMGKVSIDGEVVDSVGVRFKGFTSYPQDSDKKPIKIDFNEFVPGKRYDGLRKLNLNNSTGDASMQRDFICYDLMRSIGVYAPRVSFSKVYINDVYWGLYQTIEQVDQEFLQNNFSNETGNLFKNLSWSKFEYNGSNVSDYDQIFSLKTNTTDNDWSGFINLMDVLNNTQDDDFKEEIEKIFNVDLFLKTLAVDVATDNWDSYLDHGRNWYIYEDTQTGIFHWIPWDYNFSFPGSGGGLDGNEDCLIFAEFVSVRNGSPTVKFYDSSFSLNENNTYTWSFGDGTTSTEEDPEHTYAVAGSYEVCLNIKSEPNCDETICKFIDTNDNLYECESVVNGSFTHEVGESFAVIIDFDPSCCQIWGEQCEEFYGFFSNPGGFGTTNFKIDQRENEGVLIKRLLNESEYFDRYLDYYCSLMADHYKKDKYHNIIDSNKALIEEAVQTDPNLLASFDEFLMDIGEDGLKEIITAKIDSLNNDLVTLTSCSTVPTISLQDIVINEFVASNDSTSTITDEAGQFDDWIEIYNNTSSIVDLSDSYLSDDPDNLLKWQFPSGTLIQPDGYRIIWADKNEDQPGLHANFKLSKTGDEIFLTNHDGSEIDKITFEEQATNVSLSRIPNGTGDFTTTTSTFKANNDTGDPTSTKNLSGNIQVNIYPNPASSHLNIDILKTVKNKYNIDLLSITGQVISSMSTSEGQTRLNISSLTNGFYFLNVKDNDGNFSTIKFIKI